MNKVIVAGGRQFADWDRFVRVLDDYFSESDPLTTIIVSGCALGADSMGLKYAKQNDILVKRFVPDWSRGKIGGMLRNIEMAKYADELVAFWDGESKGTKHMIDTMRSAKKKVTIEYY